MQNAAWKSLLSHVVLVHLLAPNKLVIDYFPVQLYVTVLLNTAPENPGHCKGPSEDTGCHLGQPEGSCTTWFPQIPEKVWDELSRASDL